MSDLEFAASPLIGQLTAKDLAADDIYTSSIPCRSSCLHQCHSLLFLQAGQMLPSSRSTPSLSLAFAMGMQIDNHSSILCAGSRRFVQSVEQMSSSSLWETKPTWSTRGEAPLSDRTKSWSLGIAGTCCMPFPASNVLRIGLLTHQVLLGGLLTMLCIQGIGI